MRTATARIGAASLACAIAIAADAVPPATQTPAPATPAKSTAAAPAAAAPAAAAPATAAPAAAPAWTADPAASTLTFRALQAGAEFEGRFAQFLPAIAFAPGAAPAGRFDVTIRTGSASTGESERDGTLKGADFFDSERLPTARYLATRFTRAADGAYLAAGQLTLRGVTRDLPLRFTWTPTANGGARLAGSAALKRLDFGVGQGEWKDTQWVGNDVRIAFDLALRPAAR